MGENPETFHDDWLSDYKEYGKKTTTFTYKYNVK